MVIMWSVSARCCVVWGMHVMGSRTGEAVAAGAAKVEATIDGAAWEQNPFPYQKKCLQVLRDSRECEHTHIKVELLNEAGGLANAVDGIIAAKKTICTCHQSRR